MKLLHWLREEARSVLVVTVFFGACYIAIMLLKQLWLAEYGISFRGLSVALIAALVTAKVVIVLQKVPLTGWCRGCPGLVEVVTRSAVYTFAVLLALILEKAFEACTAEGGMRMALGDILAPKDMPAVWATTLAVGLSFLAYTTFGVVIQAIGKKRMAELFLSKQAAAGGAALER